MYVVVIFDNDGSIAVVQESWIMNDVSYYLSPIPHEWERFYLFFTTPFYFAFELANLVSVSEKLEKIQFFFIFKSSPKMHSM